MNKILLAVTAVTALMTGCGPLEGAADQHIASGSLRVVLPLSSGVTGARARLFAVGMLEGNPVDLNAVVDWSSSDEQVVAFAEPGLMEFKHAGLALLTARYQGQTASAEVRVSQAPISVLKLEGPERLMTGARGTFTLLGTRTSGEQLDLTSAAAWTFSGGLVQVGSGNEAIAALNYGVVRVTFDGRSLERTVFISNAPSMSLTISMPVALEAGLWVPLTLMHVDATGETVDATRQAEWTTSDERIAYVTNDERGALLHAVLPGSVAVTARMNGLEATAMLVVEPLRVQDLSFSQQLVEVREGEARAAEVFALRVDGTTVPLPAGATWQSSDENIVKAEAGRVIGVGRGVATVTVRYEGFTVSVAVVVQPARVISLAVSTREVRIEQGRSIDITLFGVHADGSREVMTSETTIEVAGKVSVERSGDMFSINGLEVGAGQVTFRARDCVAVVDVAVTGR